MYHRSIIFSFILILNVQMVGFPKRLHLHSAPYWNRISCCDVQVPSKVRVRSNQSGSLRQFDRVRLRVLDSRAVICPCKDRKGGSALKVAHY